MEQYGMATRVVEEGGRKRTIMIPCGEDKSYNEYLIDSSVEKTKDELKKLPEKKFVKPNDPNAVGELKERMAFRERVKTRTNANRYYGGFTLGG